LRYRDANFIFYLGEVMNIIELAKQVGYPIQHKEWRKATEEFAALVEAAARADEREECAKLCDDMDSTSDYYGPRVELICAEAIRARGEA
jgi:hypothetical protein